MAWQTYILHLNLTITNFVQFDFFLSLSVSLCSHNFIFVPPFLKDTFENFDIKEFKFDYLYFTKTFTSSKDDQSNFSRIIQS